MSSSNNPLIQSSDLPYGAPMYARIKPEHFEPAVLWAIEEGKKNLEAIRNNPDEPTFENTIAAFAFAPEEIIRVHKIIGVFTSVRNTKEVQKENDKITECVSDFETNLFIDDVIFDRVKTLYNKKDDLNLNPEETVLLEKFYDEFIANGIGLKGEERETFKKNKVEFSKINDVIRNNMVNHGRQLHLYLTADEAHRLEGIPADVVEKYREKAKGDKDAPEGGYKIPMVPPPLPVYVYAKDRSLREEVVRLGNKKCAEGEFDNHAVYRKNLEFKYEAARLLGYENHADYVLKTSQRMTDDYKEVLAFLESNARSYYAAATEFYDELKTFAKEKDGIDQLQVWDRLYYITKYREEKIGFDDEAVRPYFELNNVLGGAFTHAEKLYNVRFEKAEAGKYETVHEDSNVYEVFDNETGKIRALYYANFFSNEDKRTGAWMEDLRAGGLYQGKQAIPIIVNEMNLQKPSQGNPTLLTADEVTTLFHEMGHALHGMLSNGVYPQLSGTNVSWDYVEMPSQINECWAFKPEVLTTYARHHETGEAIPAELVEKLQELEKFDARWQGLRQTQFGLYDMTYHSMNPADITSFKELERAIDDRYPIDAVEKMADSTAMLLTFGHLIEDYAAGYYVYKWGDSLVADIRTAFEKAEKNGEGCYPETLCRNFKENMIAPGGTLPSALMLENYKNQAGCYENKGFDSSAMFKAAGIPVIR